MANHILLKESDGWYCVCCGKKIKFPPASPPAGFEDTVPKIIFSTPTSGPSYQYTTGEKVAYQHFVIPVEECPVLTVYVNMVSKMKTLNPSPSTLTAWNDVNRAIRENLELLIRLDDVMPDGYQATMRRFQGARALGGG
ncbi:MAG: hypothetical protein PHN44_01205 [Candidatus Marinimicrobia bacterium]|nr:hypothetical protein [Candidatus Neomarinimicrobiota bacterium]MDD5539088.1 hypothetical protein [Candidatus Neomarinimicrobiota bacterium]